MLEFCLVTFDIDEIREASALFPVNCYAGNPSVAAKDLAGGRATFLSRSREIRAAIGDEVPFYLEVLGDTSGEILAQTVCPEGDFLPLVGFFFAEDGFNGLLGEGTFL